MKRYPTDAIAQRESLALHPPAGTATAQIRFRYAGNNDWFWAMDDVRLA